MLSQAFSDNALKGMEEVMLLHVRQLCSILGGKGEDGKRGEEGAGIWRIGSVI